MAQHDYAIANQGFPAFRSDLNDALAAIVSNNSGATEPTTMFAHQIWVDTAANPSILKIRNADNDAWITIGTINQTGDTFTLTSAVSATTLNTSGAVVFNDAGANVDFRVEGDTEANLLFVDASTDRVGIGTDTPLVALDISSGSNSQVARLLTTGTNTYTPTASTSLGNANLQIRSGNASGSASGIRFSNGDSHELYFGTVQESGGAGAFVFQGYSGSSYAERMRIDSAGNVGIGTSSPAVSGLEISKATGTASPTPVELRLSTTNTGSDWSTTDPWGRLSFYSADTSSAGPKIHSSIDSVSEAGTGGTSGLTFNVATFSTGILTERMRITSAGNIVPGTDDAQDLGSLTQRYDDVYATNGTIQTSDRNEKQDIEELTEAETRVAVAAKALMRKYRWKSAVAEKGDEARIHFGIIAQDLQAAFEAEGLDAGRYAMFIKGEWWEKERIIPAVEGKEAVYETQTDEEGNETQVLVSEAVEAQPERTVIDTFQTEEEAGEGAVRKERMGIRYNELLAFIIAAI
jgi:hypothetical protein